MGSLASLPPSLPAPENPDYDIFACFCLRAPSRGRRTVSNWLESYNPSNNSCRRIGQIPGIADDHVLKGFSMVSLGKFIFFIGGRLCRKEAAGAEDEEPVQVDLAIRKDVLRYDVETGEWSTCAPLSTPRFDFACAVIDGRIYVAGGQCVLSTARGTSSAEVYDPLHDRWVALPEMSTLRHKCVGVPRKGRFHVVGGFAPVVVERSSAEAYDEALGEWELMSGMWQLDVPPNQIVAVGDRLFSSGDCLNTWKGHIESYDGKLKIWNIVEQSQLRDLSALLATAEDGGEAKRLYLTMAAIGARLYFLAGYCSPAGCVPEVHVFDTAASAGGGWQSFKPVATGEEGYKELCSHCCVVQV